MKNLLGYLSTSPRGIHPQRDTESRDEFQLPHVVQNLHMFGLWHTKVYCHYLSIVRSRKLEPLRGRNATPSQPFFGKRPWWEAKEGSEKTLGGLTGIPPKSGK